MIKHALNSAYPQELSVKNFTVSLENIKYQIPQVFFVFKLAVKTYFSFHKTVSNIYTLPYCQKRNWRWFYAYFMYYENCYFKINILYVSNGDNYFETITWFRTCSKCLHKIYVTYSVYLKTGLGLA